AMPPFVEIHLRRCVARRVARSSESCSQVANHPCRLSARRFVGPFEQDRLAVTVSLGSRRAGGKVDRRTAIEGLLFGPSIAMLDEHAEQRERIEVCALSNPLRAWWECGNGVVELLPRPPLVPVIASVYKRPARRECLQLALVMTRGRRGF